MNHQTKFLFIDPKPHLPIPFFLFNFKFSLSPINEFIKVIFGPPKILKKEKNTKENNFLIFGYPMGNTKENKI